MPNLAPSFETSATSHSPSTADSIASSVEGLIDTLKKGVPLPIKTNVDKIWTPPTGSQDFPHPRTVPDILLRGLFLHICAGLAYSLLITALRKQSYRRARNFPADLPGPWILWPILSILLPELVIVQLVHWTVWTRWLAIAEVMGVDASCSAQVRKHSPKSASSSDSTVSTFLQIVLLILPLWYAAKAYKQRLGMGWRAATFIANLGVDHRNGWAVVSGLVCCIAALVALVIDGLKKRHSATNVRRSRGGSLLADIVEEDEDESEKNPGVHTNGPTTRQMRTRSPPSQSRTTVTNSRDSISSIFQNADSLLPLLLTTIVHQIPVAATNRMPPLTAVFMSKWCLTIPFIILFSGLALPRAQRTVLRKALFRGDIMLVLYMVVKGMVVVIPWLLVISTVVSQFWSDSYEIREVALGIQHPWNFRWKQKDIFSRGDGDRVYMG